MDLKQNQRKQGLSRSWPMQPYWENDVATALDKSLTDSAQGPKGKFLQTVFAYLPSLPLVAHHTHTTDSFCKQRYRNCSVIEGLEEIISRFVSTYPEVQHLLGHLDSQQ